METVSGNHQNQKEISGLDDTSGMQAPSPVSQFVVRICFHFQEEGELGFLLEVHSVYRTENFKENAIFFCQLPQG